ncbi:MAG TPA: gas vesicle protein GvpG [Enteractinococcus helveticum]|uniref:Gas vesicle protein GvpG n=1 Tax=Enteractinococcus helveticum TaxID=1837282 RepID=A0A921FMV7_9MICC|nr:gas vesicle protein GvpG [Enteractinococcus helveticum]HJF14386.1 gas vesicle protein GvpG [Enteractinococcus helveticum]
MGLFSGIFFGPVKGTIWIAEQLKEEAERQYYDPASIRRQLEDVAQARQDDRITAEEATSLETELIQRLLTAHQRDSE